MRVLQVCPFFYPYLGGVETHVSTKKKSTNPCGTAASGQKAIDWDGFEAWLFKEYAKVTAKEYLSNAQKFSDCLLNGDLSGLMTLTEDQKCHALKGLSALSKFLGIHEDFKQSIKKYGLRWGSKNGDDLIIRRLTRTLDPNEIFNWIIEVKKVAPELSSFMDFMVVTGIRYSEAIQSFNLIVQLSRDGKLGEYFNAEREVLEHFRFKSIFIRNSKKLFISFAPINLIHAIAKSEPVEWRHVQKVVSWRMKKQRFGDIREFWASVMTKHLSQPEIDFLQGRVSSSVFMRNYFNPSWIGDLKTRVLEGSHEILEKSKA